MLLTALCGLSLVYFARAWRDPSGRNIALWAVFSALAVLTHFFAGFLVAPEALWLLYVIRNRTIAYAAGAVAAVQLALVPLLVSQAGNSLLGFITGTRLATRIQQVPVAFGLGTLYESSAVRYGLLGAAALAGAVIVLLVIGSDSRELRGAGAAAALAAVVLLRPTRSRSPRGGLLHTAGADARVDPARRRGCCRMHGAASARGRRGARGHPVGQLRIRAGEDQRQPAVSAPRLARCGRCAGQRQRNARHRRVRRVTRHRSTRDLPSARPMEPGSGRLGDDRRGRCRRLPLANARAPAARRCTPDLDQGRQ